MQRQYLAAVSRPMQYHILKVTSGPGMPLEDQIDRCLIPISTKMRSGTSADHRLKLMSTRI